MTSLLHINRALGLVVSFSGVIAFFIAAMHGHSPWYGAVAFILGLVSAYITSRLIDKRRERFMVEYDRKFYAMVRAKNEIMDERDRLKCHVERLNNKGREAACQADLLQEKLNAAHQLITAEGNRYIMACQELHELKRAHAREVKNFRVTVEVANKLGKKLGEEKERSESLEKEANQLDEALEIASSKLYDAQFRLKTLHSIAKDLVDGNVSHAHLAKLQETFPDLREDEEPTPLAYGLVGVRLR